MSYYARKLRYMAHDGDGGSTYVALIELSNRRRRKPLEFFLYWYTSRYFYLPHHEFKMFRFTAKTSEEAIKNFWPGENGDGKEFPDYDGSGWRRTTYWLAPVAVGGYHDSYRYDEKGFRVGAWMKICKPSPWSRRRVRKKKKPLQIGNPAHMIIVKRLEIRKLEEEKDEISYRVDHADLWTDEYYSLVKEVQRLEGEIDSLSFQIKLLNDEMRYKVYRMFPKPAVA